MSSNMGLHEEDEQEVYGAEVPCEDDAMDSVNSGIPKEGTLKDLEAIQKRFAELEQEAQALRERQAMLQMEIAQEKKVDETSALSTALAEKKEVDSRSIYVGNVDYECMPEELQEHFKICGTVNRVTILTDELGMPKGFAYVEFAEVEAVQAALALNETVVHGRLIKVAQKRTNVPGMKQFRGYPGFYYPNPYAEYEYGPVPRMKPSPRYKPY